MSEIVTVADLEPHERVVLVALLRISVLSDREVSGQEAEQIQAISSEMGLEAFETASIAAEEHGRNVRELCDLIETVERPEAQELIYAALLSAAIKDSVDSGEALILEFMETNWDVEVSFPELPDELRNGDAESNGDAD